MAAAAGNTTLWDTDLLLEIAGLRLNLFQQLHALGQRQLELIDQRDMTQLIHVLSAKHHVLAELQQAEKRLDPFRGQDPTSRRWRNPALREQCAAVVEKADQLLRVILQQEKLAETQLEQHRNETAKRLQLAHSAGHARTAYAAPAGRPGTLDITTQR